MKIKLFILLFLLISILLIGCAINEIRKIASNPDLHPKWDVDFDVAVYDMTITLADKIDDITINPLPGVLIPSAPLDKWPKSETFSLPAPVPPATENLLEVPITDIDVDSDGTDDLAVYGIYSKNASIQLKIWVENASGTPITISPESIKESTLKLTIESQPYSFKYSHTEGQKLVYNSTDFLSASNNCLYFGIDQDVDLDDLTFDSLNSGPGESIDPNYEVNFEIITNLGNFETICDIISTYFELFKEDDLPIPFDSLPLSGIDDFKFTYIIESDLPIIIDVLQEFTATPTPNPDAYPITISSGNLSSVSSPITYYYSTSSNTTNSELSFADDVTSYSNMELDMKVRVLAAKNPDFYRISPNNYIRTRMNIGGTATVSF